MMTTQQDTITHIQTFLKDATIEVTPTSATKIEDFRAHLDEGTIVYVTFLPGSDWHDTLECVKRLKTQNMRPVPHISARSTLSKTVLDESLARYRDEGCDQLLLIAGALEKPLGPFKDTIDILDTGLIQSYGYQKIGVAGHPEGSPDMSKQAICEALMAKNAFARETNLDLHIVTQFCFEFDPLIKWQKELAEWGNQLPIHIGLPGLATIKTLLKHAQACGIGNSMRFLTRQARHIAKLLTVQAPDQLTRTLATYQNEQTGHANRITNCHLYPLGGFAKSASWLKSAQQGNIILTKEGFDLI